MDRAVLFDLDGTIWDGWSWYAELLGEAGGEEAIIHLDRLRGGAPAARSLRKAGITEAIVRAAGESRPPPLFPGAAVSLSALAGAGVRIAAVTSLPAWLYRPMLGAFEDGLRLETVVGWSDAPRKPKPDPLWTALDRLELPRQGRYWYVGDTLGDCVCAKAAGMRFAWASWGYGTACPDSTDRILEAFADVEKLE